MGEVTPRCQWSDIRDFSGVTSELQCGDMHLQWGGETGSPHGLPPSLLGLQGMVMTGVEVVDEVMITVETTADRVRDLDHGTERETRHPPRAETRPRKVLGWKTPAKAFDEQLRSLRQAGVATTDRTRAVQTLERSRTHQEPLRQLSHLTLTERGAAGVKGPECSGQSYTAENVHSASCRCGL
jgi:hypothetical protein